MQLVRDDVDAGVVAFGDPVFELIAQPRVFHAGWETVEEHGAVVSVSARYWRAAVSEGGSIGGPRGSVCAEVTTEIPAFDDGAGPVRTALDQNLALAVIQARSHRARELPPQRWRATMQRWIDEVRALRISSGALTIDDEIVAGQQLWCDGFHAVAASVGDRVVTLVLNDAESAGLVRSLRRR